MAEADRQQAQVDLIVSQAALAFEEGRYREAEDAVVEERRAAAEEAAETARKTFEEGGLSENLPTIEVPASDLKAGIGMLGAFVQAGFAASNGEMRRHVKGGAVRVNDGQVSDERMTLDESHLRDGVIKLSLGKKKHVLVKPV